VTRFPPLLSPLLVKRTLRGMRLVVTGFTGPYTLGPDIGAEADHIVHVCAGSGSVPNFSMLKFALAHHPRLRHTFVYSNKTWDDVIFREELTRLAAQHPDRLTLLHALTREPDVSRLGANVRKGRVDQTLLREAIPSPTEPLVYVCGPGISKFDLAAAKAAGTPPPPRFLESVLADLKAIGVPDKRIKREFYG
jgi:ferredoxin-NADP reductase